MLFVGFDDAKEKRFSRLIQVKNPEIQDN